MKIDANGDNVRDFIDYWEGRPRSTHKSLGRRFHSAAAFIARADLRRGKTHGSVAAQTILRNAANRRRGSAMSGRSLSLACVLAALAACGPRVVVDIEPEGSGGGPTGSGGSAASAGSWSASGGSPEGSGGSGRGPAGDCGVAACQDKTSACYAFGQCPRGARRPCRSDGVRDLRARRGRSVARDGRVRVREPGSSDRLLRSLPRWEVFNDCRIMPLPPSMLEEPQ